MSPGLVSQVEVRRSASEEVSKTNNALHYFSTVKHNAGNSKTLLIWFCSMSFIIYRFKCMIMNLLSPNRKYLTHSPQSVHWPSDIDYFYINFEILSCILKTLTQVDTFEIVFELHYSVDCKNICMRKWWGMISHVTHIVGYLVISSCTSTIHPHSVAKGYAYATTMY